MLRSCPSRVLCQLRAGHISSGPSARASLGEQPPTAWWAAQLLAQHSPRALPSCSELSPCAPSSSSAVSAPWGSYCPQFWRLDIHVPGVTGWSPLESSPWWQTAGSPVSSCPCACLCPGCLFLQGTPACGSGSPPTPGRPHPDLTDYSCEGPSAPRPRPEEWGSGFPVGA